MFKHGIAGGDKIFYTTGRLTSEMVIKTVHMGIPILISRSGFTAWGVDLARQFLEADRLAAVFRAEAAVVVFDLSRVDLPNQGGPFDHLRLHILRCLVGRPAGGVGDAAAAGDVGVADAARVADAGVDVLCRQPQGLGEPRATPRP